jgi:hypothetical protein
MTVRSPLAVLALAFMGAIGAAGCGGTSADRVEVVPGTLVVDWTVNGSKDPSQCDLGQAREIAITLVAPDGAVVGEYRQDCAAMATSITLAPESYGASAELLDSAGVARTTAVTIPGFSINSAEQYPVTVDFPANSFL